MKDSDKPDDKELSYYRHYENQKKVRNAIRFLGSKNIKRPEISKATGIDLKVLNDLMTDKKKAGNRNRPHRWYHKVDGLIEKLIKHYPSVRIMLGSILTDNVSEAEEQREKYEALRIRYAATLEHVQALTEKKAELLERLIETIKENEALKKENELLKKK